MARQSRPVPPALEGNDLLFTGILTACWGVAFVVALLIRHDVAAADRWWIWTCAAGFALGLFGLAYAPRLQRSRARAADRRASQSGQAGI